MKHMFQWGEREAGTEKQVKDTERRYLESKEPEWGARWERSDIFNRACDLPEKEQ